MKTRALAAAAAFLPAVVLAAAQAHAGTFKIEEPKPISVSKPLTLKSDRTIFYEIRPGADVVLKVEGPGTLTVLGIAQADSSAGDLTVTVVQDSQVIGVLAMVARGSSKDGWVERTRVPLSAPASQKFSIGAGAHTITCKASATSAIGALRFQLAKEEQTVAAAPEPELVPLIPLVPLSPKKEEPKPPPAAQQQPPPGPEPVPLVPLAPLPKKEAVSTAPVAKDEGKWKEVIASPAPPPGRHAGVKAEVPKAEKKEPSEPVKYVTMSPRVGMMMPVQGIGGPFPVFGAEVRYLPPLSGQPLSVGVSVDYYAPFFTADISSTKTAGRSFDASYYVIPVQLVAVWTFETGTLVQPYAGLGGGLYIVGSSLDDKSGGASTSEGGMVGGFCGLGGVNIKIGPGEIVAEARMNQAKLSLGKTMKDLHAGGVILEAGYKFTF